MSLDEQEGNPKKENDVLSKIAPDEKSLSSAQQKFKAKLKMAKSQKIKVKKLKKQHLKNILKLDHDLTDILQQNRPKSSIEKELEEHVLGCSVENDDIVEEKQVKEKRKLIPAWEDDDDETILIKEKSKDFKNCPRSVLLRGDEKYSEYLQESFTKAVGNPKWAELDREDRSSGDEIEDELLQRAGDYVTQTEYLPKGNIHIKKCPSLHDSNMKGAIIKSAEFHPTSRVGLVATSNGVANIFQIDGKENPKIQSIYFENFPICTAHFSVDGTEILASSGQFVHLFSYDMHAGKIAKIPWQKGMDQWRVRKFSMSPDGKYIVINGRYGDIHLMTTKSKEWVGSLKMNGEVEALSFSRDGTKMYSHGRAGEVYIWDMSSRKCMHKFTDEGCILGTALAVSPNQQFLATGSDCGVVNVYDTRTIFDSTNPKPMKTILNLTTQITDLKFNSTSEILAMSSAYKDDAVKLVHFPSMTVFQNFPLKDSLKRPNSMDFSVNSGYLCIGNNIGTTYVYRLNHYKNF